MNKVYIILIVAIVVLAIVLVVLISRITNSMGQAGTTADTTPQTSDTLKHDESTSIDETTPEPETSDAEMTTEPETEAQSTESEEVTTDAASSEPETSEAETTTEPETEAQPPQSDSIEVTTLNEDVTNGDAEITMNYPILTSAGQSPHSVDELNAAIREFMDDKRRVMCLEAPGDEYEYRIEKTDIKYVGKNFFSALITGHLNTDGDSHPMIFAYTVNCDAQTCSILTKGDLIFDFNAVRDKFTSGAFKLVAGGEELPDEIDYEDLFLSYRPEYGIYPDVYYTDTGFGLAVETVYTLGGYAVFEIPRSELGDAVYVPQN